LVGRYWVLSLDWDAQGLQSIFERVLCENARKCLNVIRSPLKTRKSYWIPNVILTNFIQSVVQGM